MADVVNQNSNIYFQVAIDVPLMRTFTYKFSDDLFTQVDNNSKKVPAIGDWVYVPFGKQKNKLGLLVGNDQNSAFVKLAPEKILPLHCVVQAEIMPLEWLELIRFASEHYHYPLGQVVAQAYPMVIRKKIGVELKAKIIKPKWLKLNVSCELIKTSENFNRKKNFQKLLHLFSKNNLQHWDEISETYPNLLSTVKEWQKLNWLIEEIAAVTAKVKILTTEQNNIVENIWNEYLKNPKFTIHLIQGITGSGKTEIYFSLAQKVLASGKQVLILMPEIALTPQMNYRIAERFPQYAQNEIAILHSSVAEGERQRAFVSAMRGQAKIIVGTRLAIFTPIKNLGLIVVDEEHDASYKQHDTAFSYSGRDLAIYRASKINIPIVLGSATPSLESYNAALQNRYQLHIIDNRAVDGSSLPQIKCINIRGVKLDNGIAPESLEIIKTALQNQEQILIFLNRRGYSPTVFCQSCGWLAGCESCSANLVLHRVDNCLRCHHCGYREPIINRCPQCGNPDIEMRGFGTQKLEEIMRGIFPKVNIMRIDRDASGSYKTFTEQQKQIAEGKVDLIIGTQMMAKGHDFPKLTTVLVLGADLGLFASDYRGPERMFALLMQVAGRAGRHHKAGKVYVQTAWIEHPLFAYLISHDYRGFAENELKTRAQVPVPPFCFQALLRVEAVNLNLAMDWLKEHRKIFATYCPREVTIYDAIPMRLSRKANWERIQMLVESPARPILHKFLKSLSEYLYTIPQSSEIKWWLDISPLEV